MWGGATSLYMNIYTIYSPSHRIFYDRYYTASLPNECVNISKQTEQICSTGTYKRPGWEEFCYSKVLLFQQANRENLGSYFIFSDVDIEYFGNIKEVLIKELEGSDIACQRDYNQYCSGLFIVRASEKTQRMFNLMRDNYEKEDQHTLNKFIRLVKHKYLSKRFYNYSQSKQCTENVWDKKPFEIPDDILAFHANWTVGINNKIEMLEFVRRQVYGRII